jgi:alanyl aminopeptidase
MFEHYIGEDAFRNGVIQYLKQHEFANATAADLWNALSAASGKDITAAMGTFLDQPGVPRVDVEVLAGGKVRLTQTRMLPFGSKAPAEQLWKIPMVLKFSDGKSAPQTRTTLLEQKTAEVALTSGADLQWVVPNAEEGGYYRCSVPSAMLQTLSQQARGSLSERERVALVGNSSALMGAGLMHADDFMRTLLNFADDPSPQVISTVSNSLDLIETTFVTPDLEAPFDRYVRSLLTPALHRFGLRHQAGEGEQAAMVRPGLMNWLGRRVKDETVLAYADSLAKEYCKDPESVDPALAGTAVRLSAIRGDRALFLDYRARFEGAKTPAERGVYLGALGGFENEGLEEEALQYALTGPLRPQELFTIPGTVGGRGRRHEMKVWEWMANNYDAIKGKVPPMYLAFFPMQASGCDEHKLELAKSFFGDATHQVPGTLRQLGRVSERVMACVDLRNREGAAAAAYLNGKVGAR